MKPFEGYDPDNLYAFSMQSSLWNVTYQAEVLGEWIWTELLPGSVIDIGCGPGCYLLPFKRHGCETFGVDACEVGGLLIAENFERVDLRFPYVPSKRFDLVQCIEVAEHLEEKYAEGLLDILVSCADLVLFSAAVPGQPGEYHVNLQPFEYWLSKFARRGYELHPLQDSMRRFLDTLPEATLDRADGCHSWLKNNLHLLERRC